MFILNNTWHSEREEVFPMFQEFRCHILSIYIFCPLHSKAWFSGTARIMINVSQSFLKKCRRVARIPDHAPVPIWEAEDLSMIVLEIGKGDYGVKGNSSHSVYRSMKNPSFLTNFSYSLKKRIHWLLFSFLKSFHQWQYIGSKVTSAACVHPPPLYLQTEWVT